MLNLSWRSLVLISAVVTVPVYANAIEAPACNLSTEKNQFLEALRSLAPSTAESSSAKICSSEDLKKIAYIKADNEYVSSSDKLDDRAFRYALEGQASIRPTSINDSRKSEINFERKQHKNKLPAMELDTVPGYTTRNAELVGKDTPRIQD